QTPGISLDKASTTTQITAANQVVPYTYLVTNTGIGDVTGRAVTDNQVASISCTSNKLAVGAHMTCTGSHTVTQTEINSGGNLVNLATADSDQTGPVTDSGSIPIVQTPGISIAKSSGTTSIDHANQVVPYSYLVTNT